MKKLFFALAALVVATTASAQSSTGGKLGLGIAITPTTPYTFTNAGPVFPAVEVFVPFALAPNLRLEPEIGIFTNDQPTGGTDTSNITLGAGLFFLQKSAPNLDVYAGGRLKLNFASFDNGATDDSGVDFILAAAAGGEYYLAPKFSIGAEAQLGFYSNSDVSGDDSGFFTNGLGFLRVYF